MRLVQAKRITNWEDVDLYGAEEKLEDIWLNPFRLIWLSPAGPNGEYSRIKLAGEEESILVYEEPSGMVPEINYASSIPIKRIDEDL